jgi:putative DNA primase/helicase
LRFVPHLWHAEERTNYPGMLAKVMAPDGRPTNVHRTYLSEQGGKAPVEEPRLMMAGTVCKGAAVRLGRPVAGVLGIAEGIETALSAAALFGVPCWAALNASLLKSWIAPAGISEVIVFADNDDDFTGQDAAYALARRLSREGLRARVEVPEEIGLDWNDVHLATMVCATPEATALEEGERSKGPCLSGL